MSKRLHQTYIGREKYVVVLLKVEGRDPDGRMRDLRLLRDEESTHIDGGEEFVTAYVMADVISAGPKRGRA